MELARTLLCSLDKVSKWDESEEPTLIEKCLRQLGDWHQKEKPELWLEDEKEQPEWIKEYEVAHDAFVKPLKGLKKKRKALLEKERRVKKLRGAKKVRDDKYGKKEGAEAKAAGKKGAGKGGEKKKESEDESDDDMSDSSS